MKHICLIVILALCVLCGCKKAAETSRVEKEDRIKVTELGNKIQFENEANYSNFRFDTVRFTKLTIERSAPARVVASVVRNIDQKQYNLVLFSDPELTANYSVYLERLVNIKTFKLNLERANDLFMNGAATGREVIEAQTQLNNEEAAIIENEAKFYLAGLDPKDFQSHDIGTVWLICEIPEDDVDKYKEGSKCLLKFKSFEKETFYGDIESLGDVVDNVTRMVKLRIELKNKTGKIKPGMFGSAEFGITEGQYLCVSENAIINVQGKDYVFVRNANHMFERRFISAASQIGSKITINSGLSENDVVVTDGVMQLKGLSFGF